MHAEARIGRTKWAAVAVVGSMAAGCGGSVSGEAALSVTATDSAGIEIVTIAGPVDRLPEWHLSDEPLAVVSGEAEPFLSWVGEIEILGDGRFWVEDNQTAGLYLFEADASGFRTVAREGDGPGEFRNLTELSLGVGDTAFAYDRRLYRVTAFDPAGEFVSSVQIGREFGGPRSLSLDAWGFDSDRLLLLSDVPVDTLETRVPRRAYSHGDLYSLDQEAEPRGAPVRFDGGYSIRDEMFDGGAHFGNRPIVATGGGRVVWGSANDYELTIGSPTLEPMRVVRWEGWRQPLGDSLLAHVRDTTEQGLAAFREQRPELVDAIMNASFHPEIVPDTLPALGLGLVDDRGRIWVSRFRPSVDEWRQEDVWHVLSPDGHPLARLRLGPLTQLKAVRGDRVAVVYRDELEVQHVRIHSLIEEGR